jgi:hypothetical protein
VRIIAPLAHANTNKALPAYKRTDFLAKRQTPNAKRQTPNAKRRALMRAWATYCTSKVENKDARLRASVRHPRAKRNSF